MIGKLGAWFHSAAFVHWKTTVGMTILGVAMSYLMSVVTGHTVFDLTHLLVIVVFAATGLPMKDFDKSNSPIPMAVSEKAPVLDTPITAGLVSQAAKAVSEARPNISTVQEQNAPNPLNAFGNG